MRLNPVERLIQAACAAANCRRAAIGTDAQTAAALRRAADRYSGLVADMAREIATGGVR